jgi:hypothetical protein
MIDDSVNPMLPVIGASLDRVSAPFSGERWTATLGDLRRAEWLFSDTAGAGDAVARAIAADRRVATDFEEVFAEGTVRVHHRRTPPPALAATTDGGSRS